MREFETRREHPPLFHIVSTLHHGQMAYSLSARPNPTAPVWKYVFTITVDCRGDVYTNEHTFSITPLCSDRGYAVQCEAIEAVDSDRGPEWFAFLDRQDRAVERCEDLAYVYDRAHESVTRTCQAGGTGEVNGENTDHNPGVWFFKFEIYKSPVEDHQDHVKFKVQPVEWYAGVNMEAQRKCVAEVERDRRLRERKANCIASIEADVRWILNMYNAEFNKMLTNV